MNLPIDGVWREDEGSDWSSDGVSTGDGPPTWLMKALRESGQVGSPDASASAKSSPLSQPNVPPRGFTAPPIFTRDLPEGFNDRQQPPFSPSSGQSLISSSGGAGSHPLGQMAPQTLQTPQGSSLFVQPSIANQSGQLIRGASLKGGRYRLIQPFYGTGLAQPPKNEPSLMIASDTELPNGRVLIQEVLLNAVRPEDSENARRLIAQRLLTLRSYPAMPRLVDHFSEQWHHYLVFEFPSGDLLADRLQRAHGPMLETAAIHLALQITDVLEVFEQQSPPFIHGNLSPASIILRPSGQAVVVGCSPHLLLYPDGTVDHPPAGGIPGYGAPEQFRGQATTRSDIFAVCAILHHAVTGVAPITRANAPHPSARHQNPDVSLELEEVLSHGMRPSWTQRYQSAVDLRNALDRLISGQVTRVPEELRDQNARTPGLAPARDAQGRLILPRQRRLQSPLFLFGVILCLIVLIGGAVLFAASPRTSATTAVPTPNSLAQLVQQENIGLSGGEFTFDTERLDSAYKTQGSLYLDSGNLAGAHSSFLTAVSTDPTDAEAAIYAEDLQISLERAPFITVVVGTAFDLNADFVDVAAARSELQGIYLAQRSINTAHLLPDGVRLRVVILNSGLTPAGATTAAHVLLAQIKNGNAEHIVGIIGWPELAQTQLARSELKLTGLPLITPTGDDDSLTNSGASLFRMVPLESAQAQQLADVAVQKMGATNVVVLSDPKDQISSSMAYSFIARLAADQTITPISEHSMTYTSNVNANFVAIAQQAIAHDGANLIYLSTGQQGGDMDSIDLAKAVVAASRNADVKTPPILVDSRAYTPALLGLGSTPAAALVQAIATPAVYSDLYVETLANVQEWTALNLPASEPNSFSYQFTTQYDTALSPDELVGPNATIILCYDALDMLAAASSSAIGRARGAIAYPTLTNMRNNLLAFSTIHPFIGVSGAISYDQAGNVNGDLPNTDIGPGRAFGILQFVPFATPLSDGQLASAQIAWVAGGVAAFCSGPVTCSPSPV